MNHKTHRTAGVDRDVFYYGWMT